MASLAKVKLPWDGRDPLIAYKKATDMTATNDEGEPDEFDKLDEGASSTCLLRLC